MSVALPVLSHLFLVCSLAVSVPELPPSDFADTEVTTNIPATVRFDETSRICFTLSLAASPTNALEVSIGTDRNHDGHLSVEEADHTFGYDCGVWFVREPGKDGLREEKADLTAGRLAREFLLRRPRLDAAWDLVKVTRRGTPAIVELTTVEGQNPGLLLMLK